MYDFNECKNSTAVKNKVREIAFADLLEFFIGKYGEDNVSIVDSNEIAVCVGLRTLADGTDSECCFTTKPVVKDFEDRIATASGKEFKAYERIKEAEAYEDAMSKKEAEAEENARRKAEKKARDEAERARKKAERQGGRS